jgi:hypothetical protein
VSEESRINLQFGGEEEARNVVVRTFESRRLLKLKHEITLLSCEAAKV